MATDQASAPKKPQRILITGSRIPVYVAPGTQVLPTISPVRVYSRAQLLSTGRDHDLGAALQTLDPSVSATHR